MRIGWLQDDPGYVGGAELTANDLRAAAPDDVEIVTCDPGRVEDHLDLYIVHNCMFYDELVDRPVGKVVRFIHDDRGPGPIDGDTRIFYSPLQRKFSGLDGHLCPAPLDAERFKPTRQINRHRKGAVHIGTFGHPGKGQEFLEEWAIENGGLTVYGHGPFPPSGPAIDFKGPIEHKDVPNALWNHATFVHLPRDLEAYGRGVVEAWAAGCELVVNRNVGALYWIQEDPEAIATAAETFWEVALNA